MVYLITYDISTEHPNYEEVIGAIKSLGSSTHAMLSVWFVDTQYTAEQIYNHLGRHLRQSDRLFICQINSNQTGWLNKEAVNWLSKRVL